MYYFDHDGDFRGVCIVQIHQIIYIKYMQFFGYRSYFSKTVLKICNPYLAQVISQLVQSVMWHLGLNIETEQDTSGKAVEI